MEEVGGSGARSTGSVTDSTGFTPASSFSKPPKMI